jgi:carbamoyl-phosphate synthase small subunit
LSESERSTDTASAEGVLRKCKILRAVSGRKGFSIPPQRAWEEPKELLQTAETKTRALSFLKDRLPASLFLEDGTKFAGYSFGASKSCEGEVVFSTSMVGYSEALTDPSYRGQVLSLTYPLVGNYGVPGYDLSADGLPTFFESDRIQVRGLIVHEACGSPSHYQSARTLDGWLKEEGVSGIYGVDTRRLARVLRERGVMLGRIQMGNDLESRNPEQIPNPNLSNLVKEVTVDRTVNYHPERKNRIVLLDCGTKLSIIRNLLKRGVSVVRMPYDSNVDEVMAQRPMGVVLSNGPGDPKICTGTIQTARELMQASVPVLGICLGSQLIALAAGADTYKMKYGHRSQNQPVLDTETGRCYITTQNHGYAVDRESLEKSGMRVWFVNANDKSIEGIRHPKKPCWGVQWHPEASPGPTDTEFIFDFFLKKVLKHAKA